jgi:glycosyltransferase involved in cell wall biosynthesis
MTVVLFRPSLDARSGAGQLIEMQWRGLRAAGIDAVVACERGALKYWLRTGVRAKRRRAVDLPRDATIVDHGLAVPRADLAFVHNLAGEVLQRVPGADVAAQAERERRALAELRPTSTVVANSRLVAEALTARYGVAAERVAVLYPGYRSQQFTPQRALELRAAARNTLGVPSETPLVGFVTSGDFAKRGLDVFLDCAARIARQRADTRFLVVGSKELPRSAQAHALVRSGAVQHRPKGADPERWLAALDVFLYAARYEEFGMVVAEAQAMGVPVLTSKLVGASECLPKVYAPWLLERPDAPELADRALALLADAPLRRELGAAGAASVTAFDERAYGAGTLDLIAAQKRRVQ